MIDAVLHKAASRVMREQPAGPRNASWSIEALPVDILLRIAQQMDSHPLHEWYTVAGFREKVGIQGGPTEVQRATLCMVSRVWFQLITTSVTTW